MKKLAMLAAATVFVFGAMANAPQAEARRGYGGGAGIVAALVIGGIVAASLASRRRSYAYYPRRTAYYGPSYAYAAPTYYRSYRRPVYYSRPVYSRPVSVYRAGFTRGNRGGWGRRWR